MKGCCRAAELFGHVEAELVDLLTGEAGCVAFDVCEERRQPGRAQTDARTLEFVSQCCGGGDVTGDKGTDELVEAVRGGPLVGLDEVSQFFWRSAQGPNVGDLLGVQTPG